MTIHGQGSADSARRLENAPRFASTTTQPETIGQYLEALENSLAGQDPALVQDALADAEEYLCTELVGFDRDQPAGEQLATVVASYGSPAEVAQSYLEADLRLPAGFPGLSRPADGERVGLAERFFRVVLDPLAYSSLLFNLAGLITGILYFTWVVTGTSLTLGLSVLIIGLPFALIFLTTLPALALVEGRLVEGLLGLRMPRRPRRATPPKGLVERLLYRLRNRRTWSTWLYLVLRLPVGLLAFTVFVVLLALNAGLVSTPVAQLVFGLPAMNLGEWQVFWPSWLLWVPVLSGGLGFVVTLHLSKIAGRIQGRLAKAMLVEAG